MSTSSDVAGQIAATSYLSRQWLGECQLRVRGELGGVLWPEYQRAMQRLSPCCGSGLEGPLVLLRLAAASKNHFELFLHWAALPLPAGRGPRPARPAPPPAALTPVQAAKVRYSRDVGAWADHVCDCNVCSEFQYCATARRLHQRVRRSMAALRAAYEAEAKGGPP